MRSAFRTALFAFLALSPILPAQTTKQAITINQNTAGAVALDFSSSYSGGYAQGQLVVSSGQFYMSRKFQNTDALSVTASWYSMGSTAPTSAQVQTALQALTGCSTAGYVYVPASNTCVSNASGASTPSTSNLLKGNGAVNSVTAAVPETDYVTASGTGTLLNKTVDGASPAAIGFIANLSSDAQAQISANAANITLQQQTGPGFDTADATLWDVFDLHEGSGGTLHGIVNGNTCTLGTTSTDPQWSNYSLVFSSTTNTYITCAGMTNPVTFQVVARWAPSATLYQAFAGVAPVATNGFFFAPEVPKNAATTADGSQFRIDQQSVYTPGVGTYGINQINVLSFTGGTTTYGFINGQQLTNGTSNSSLGIVSMPTGSSFTVGGSNGITGCNNDICQLKSGAIYGFAVYSTQPSSQSAMQRLVSTNQVAWTEVLAKHGAAPGQFIGTGATIPTELVCGLTSIESGYLSNSLTCATGNTGLSSSAYSVGNIAIPGSTLSAWFGSGFQSFGSYAAPSAARRYAFLGSAITNDLCQNSGGNSTVSGAWQMLQQSVTSLKKLGFDKVFIGTMLSRTGNGAGTGNTSSTCDALHDQVNTLIRANARAVGYTLVDAAADPRLGADGASANTTYFNSDAIHPSSTGQGVYGAIVGRVITAEDGATLAAPNTGTDAAYAMSSADNYLLAQITAARTYTLPDCLGLTGRSYDVFNTSSSSVLTMQGTNSETITGSATVAAGAPAVFTSQLTSASAGGCYWLRTQ